MKDIVYYDEKKKAWINRITNRTTSERTAKRYNTRYRNLKEQGYKDEDITMNLLYGNKFTYKKGKTIRGQSEKTQNVMNRKRQFYTTRNMQGKQIRISPTYGKIKEKKKIPLHTTICGQRMYLYRMNTVKDRVYHILRINVNKEITSGEHLELFRNSINHKIKCIINNIPYIKRTYPLEDMNHFGRIAIRKKNMNIGLITDSFGDIFGQTNLNASAPNYIYQTFQGVLDAYREELIEASYTSIIIESIQFNFYTIVTPNDIAYHQAKYRVGIQNIF